MTTLLVILLAFVAIIAALAVPAVIRDRRHAPARYSGRRHLSPHDSADGVSPYGGAYRAGGFNRGFDGGGGFDAGGFGGDGGGSN